MLRLKSLLPSRQTVSSLIGVVCALLAMEIALRPFVAGWNYPAGPIREIRQYAEGVATSHFIPDGLSPYGWRLTGNPEIAPLSSANKRMFGLSNSKSFENQVRPDTLDRRYSGYTRTCGTARAGTNPAIVVLLSSILLSPHCFGSQTAFGRRSVRDSVQTITTMAITR